METLNETIEPSILLHRSQSPSPSPPSSPHKRPFLDSTTSSHPPSLKESKTEIVNFPEKDESIGEISLSFVGGELRDWKQGLAHEVIGNYLTESSVAPMNKVFVEVEEPFCTGALAFPSHSVRGGDDEEDADQVLGGGRRNHFYDEYSNSYNPYDLSLLSPFLSSQHSSRTLPQRTRLPIKGN